MTGADRQRLFLAASLDDTTRNLLAAHLEAQQPGSMPGRSVPPQNWHLTLRFLGWATEHQRDGILHYLDETEMPTPFVVRFGALGAFPRARRATVLWLGVDQGGEALTQVAGACDEAAQAVGYEPEGRPFHPHVTLSRIRPHQDVSALIESFDPFLVKMRVAAVTLYESLLRRGGAIYRAIDRVEL